LKHWKSGLEEATYLCSLSDCLQAVAAVFAGSQFFQQLKAYTSVQGDTSIVRNSSNAVRVHGTGTRKTEPVSEQLISGDFNSTSDVSDTQHSVSHGYTPDLSAFISLPPCLGNSATDDDVALNDAAASNKDASEVSETEAEISNKPRKSASASRQIKTRQMSALKVKPVGSLRTSRKSAASVSDNKVNETLKTENSSSAGITHILLSFLQVVDSC